jgi:hypothetical protein
MIVPSNVAARMKRVSGLKGYHSYFELTFDLLPLFPSDELGNFHRITYEWVPTSVMHSTFDGRFKLNDINDEACSLRKRAELDMTLRVSRGRNLA